MTALQNVECDVDPRVLSRENLTVDLLRPQLRNHITVTEDHHWLWTPAGKRGYAYTWSPARKVKHGAHGVVYEELVRAVPTGLELDHTCEYRNCVFPGCLDEVTHAENQRRASWRQLQCRRAGHWYTPSNTYIDPHNKKRCRACAAEAQRLRVRTKNEPEVAASDATRTCVACGQSKSLAHNFYAHKTSPGGRLSVCKSCERERRERRRRWAG